jgi:hypothetical protein
MSDNKEPKTLDVKDVDRKIIRALPKYFAPGTTLTIHGTDYTPSSLAALFQQELDDLEALRSARARLKQMVADSLRARRKTRKVREGLRSYVVTVHGPEALKVLGDFGIPVPKKPGPKTAEVKAEAVAKGQATRKAREEALEKVTKKK